MDTTSKAKKNLKIKMKQNYNNNKKLKLKDTEMKVYTDIIKELYDNKDINIQAYFQTKNYNYKEEKEKEKLTFVFKKKSVSSGSGLKVEINDNIYDCLNSIWEEIQTNESFSVSHLLKIIYLPIMCKTMADFMQMVYIKHLNLYNRETNIGFDHNFWFTTFDIMAGLIVIYRLSSSYGKRKTEYTSIIYWICN